MSDFSGPLAWIVTLVAFGIGYALVSALMSRLTAKGRGDSAVQRGKPGVAGSPRLPATVRSAAARRHSGSTRRPEQEYASLLGLGLPFTSGELERQYRAKLSECSPDRLSDGSDMQLADAAQRAGEVAEAYEYFRDKYIDRP